MIYKCFVKIEPWNDAIEIHLLGHNIGEQPYYFNIKNSKLEAHKRNEGEMLKEPLLRIMGKENILLALVEGLKEAGYVAEVDNAQRITSEAIAKERKEEISWLRIQIEKQL